MEIDDSWKNHSLFCYNMKNALKYLQDFHKEIPLPVLYRDRHTSDYRYTLRCPFYLGINKSHWIFWEKEECNFIEDTSAWETEDSVRICSLYTDIAKNLFFCPLSGYLNTTRGVDKSILKKEQIDNQLKRIVDV